MCPMCAATVYASAAGSVTAGGFFAILIKRVFKFSIKENSHEPK